jgi:hypothetical protein
MKICLAVLDKKQAYGETYSPIMHSFISVVISIHLTIGNENELSNDNVTNNGESDIYYFGDEWKIICSW